MQVGIESLNPRTLDGMAYSNQGRNLKTFSHFEEFVEGTDPVNFWRGASSGAGSAVWSSSGAVDRPGQAYCSTGTTNVGYAYLAAGGISRNAILMGGGVYTWETDIYLPELSTAAEEYAVYLGFGDTEGGDQSDGVYFRYTRASSLNWITCAAGAGVRTANITLAPVVAAAWVRLKVIASPTQALYYVNGVLVDTITTNLPLVQTTGLMMTIIKAAGITERIIMFDWTWVHIELDVTR